MPTWAIWVGSLGFLFLRALLAASEAALYGISDLKAKELEGVHPRRGKRVVRHKTEREATAATLRLAITLCGFCAVGLAALVPPRMLDLTRFGNDAWLPAASALAGATAMALLASLFDVTFRAMAINSPESWSLWTSGMVSALRIIVYPLLRLLVGILNILVRPFGGRVRFEAPPPPLEELEKLLAAQAANSQLDKDAPQLIRSIFSLSDKRCRDVMVPRTEVVGIDVSTKPTEILQLLAEENHSRLPVYQDDMDHIVGVLHARDLIPMMQHPELIVLRDIIRPAAFVPWVKPIGDLLRDMQKKRIHMAIVVDEYGGFMGIVTLEDILREIVGDIGDEFEVIEKEFERQNDGSYLARASAYKESFEKLFGVTFPEGEWETLGGFLASLSGSIPEVSDKFNWNGFTFIVQSKDGPRLDKIRIIRPKPQPPSAEKEKNQTAAEKRDASEDKRRQDQAALARGTG